MFPHQRGTKNKEFQKTPWKIKQKWEYNDEYPLTMDRYTKK